MPVAIIAAAAITAGSAIYGANKASASAKSASQGINKRFAETKDILQPFIDSGQLALHDLQASLGVLGPEEQAAFYKAFQTDPGFTEANNFALNQVNDRYKLSGKGGGNLLAALSDRARNDLFSQFQIRQGQLSDLVGKGITAGSSLAGVGTTSAAQAGQLGANAGLLAGSGIVNAGNSIAGGIDQYALLKGYDQGNASQLVSPGTMANGGWSTSIVPTNRLTF